MIHRMESAALRALAFVAVLVVSSTASAGEFRRVVSDYAITPQSGLGIIRAFFYGPNAVIEFENPPSSFSAVDAAGKEVEFEPEGRFVRLIGRPTVFTAMFSGKAATFRSFTETAKIPKPTVDELAKFDNFYSEKGGNQVTPVAPIVQATPVQAPVAAAPAPIHQVVAPVYVPQQPASQQVAQPVAAAQIATFALPPTPKEKWRVQLNDQTLKGTLTRWASTAGWQLSWEVTQDIPVTLTATFEGTFKQAVESVFESLAGSDSPVKGCLYDNDVLRVVPRSARCELRQQSI